MFKRMTKEEKKIGRRYYRRVCFISAVIDAVLVLGIKLAVKD